MNDPDTQAGEPLRRYTGVSGLYPFRLGTTSFILPADILPNVQILAGIVDDVELLVFESDAISPLPSTAVVAALLSIQQQQPLSYTVHMPVDVNLLHPDPGFRRAETNKWIRVAERMRPLQPKRFVLHLPTLPEEEKARKAILQELEHLCSGGVTPQQICVENTQDDLLRWEPVIREMGLSICLDIGHLLLHGYDPLTVLDRFGSITRILHVHGVAEGKDHRDLEALDRSLLIELLAFACKADPDTVFTIEVFGMKPLVRSMAVLEGLGTCAKST